MGIAPRYRLARLLPFIESHQELVKLSPVNLDAGLQLVFWMDDRKLDPSRRLPISHEKSDEFLRLAAMKPFDMNLCAHRCSIGPGLAE